MASLRAKTYFAAGRRIVRAGDLLPDNDPIVKGREHLFETPEEATPAAHACDQCDFVARSAGGLTTHKRSHED